MTTYFHVHNYHLGGTDLVSVIWSSSYNVPVSEILTPTPNILKLVIQVIKSLKRDTIHNLCIRVSTEGIILNFISYNIPKLR